MARHLLTQKLFTAGSVLNAVSAVIGPNYGSKAEESVFYIKFGAGTSAGAVTIEEANDPLATVWSPVAAAVVWSTVDTEKVVRLLGNFRNIRARISTAAVGGTIDVTAVISG